MTSTNHSDTAREACHTARRAGRALAVLQNTLGESADESLRTLGRLTESEQEQLAAAGEDAELAGHVLKEAAARMTERTVDS